MIITVPKQITLFCGTPIDILHRGENLSGIIPIWPASSEHPKTLSFARNVAATPGPPGPEIQGPNGIIEELLLVSIQDTFRFTDMWRPVILGGTYLTRISMTEFNRALFDHRIHGTLMTGRWTWIHHSNQIKLVSLDSELHKRASMTQIKPAARIPVSLVLGNWYYNAHLNLSGVYLGRAFVNYLYRRRVHGFAFGYFHQCPVNYVVQVLTKPPRNLTPIDCPYDKLPQGPKTETSSYYRSIWFDGVNNRLMPEALLQAPEPYGSIFGYGFHPNTNTQQEVVHANP